MLLTEAVLVLCPFQLRNSGTEAQDGAWWSTRRGQLSSPFEPSLLLLNNQIFILTKRGKIHVQGHKPNLSLQTCSHSIRILEWTTGRGAKVRFERQHVPICQMHRHLPEAAGRHCISWIIFRFSSLVEFRENCAAWWRFLRSQNKRNTVVCNRANSSQLKPFFIPLASRTEMSTKRKGTEHTFTFDLRFPILWRTIRAERSRIWNRVQLPANERAAGKFVRKEQMRTGKRNATSLLWTVIRRVGRLLTALVIRLGLSLILNQSTPRLKSY